MAAGIFAINLQSLLTSCPSFSIYRRSLTGLSWRHILVTMVKINTEWCFVDEVVASLSQGAHSPLIGWWKEIKMEEGRVGPGEGVNKGG